MAAFFVGFYPANCHHSIYPVKRGIKHDRNHSSLPLPLFSPSFGSFGVSPPLLSVLPLFGLSFFPSSFSSSSFPPFSFSFSPSFFPLPPLFSLPLSSPLSLSLFSPPFLLSSFSSLFPPFFPPFLPSPPSLFFFFLLFPPLPLLSFSVSGFLPPSSLCFSFPPFSPSSSSSVSFFPFPLPSGLWVLCFPRLLSFSGVAPLFFFSLLSLPPPLLLLSPSPVSRFSSSPLPFLFGSSFLPSPFLLSPPLPSSPFFPPLPSGFFRPSSLFPLLPRSFVLSLFPFRVSSSFSSLLSGCSFVLPSPFPRSSALRSLSSLPPASPFFLLPLSFPLCGSSFPLSPHRLFLFFPPSPFYSSLSLPFCFLVFCGFLSLPPRSRRLLLPPFVDFLGDFGLPLPPPSLFLFLPS